MLRSSKSPAYEIPTSIADASDEVLTKKNWRTEALVIATNAVDSADKALLPGTFRTLEMDFALDPKTLAQLVLTENIIQSLVTPIWGYFSDRYSRRRLLLSSCIVWGTTTLLVGSSSSFNMLFGSIQLNQTDSTGFPFP